MMKATRLRSLLLVSLLSGVASSAHGHAGVPGTTQLFPDGDQLIVGSLGFGVFVGQEGGTWRWICDQAINRRTDRVFARTGSGGLLATNYFGIDRSTDGGCTWTHPPGDIASREAGALVADPVKAHRVWATTRSNRSAPWNALFVSDDDGAAWRAAWQGDEFLGGLAVSGDGRTIYFVGFARSAPYSTVLHVSSDGGSTFRTTALDMNALPALPVELFPRAVDPHDPSVLWLVADLGTADALWRSTGYGASVTEELRVATGIGNLVFDDARKAVLVATRAGIHRSVAGGPFVRIGRLESVASVDLEAGVLRACASTLPPDSAAVARSDDGGDSFTAVMCLGDAVGPLDCPAGSPVSMLCPSAWPAASAQLGPGCAAKPDIGVPGSSDGGVSAPIDAAAPDSALVSHPGASCTLSPRRPNCDRGAISSTRGIAVLAIALFTGAIRRVRRRRIA